MNQEPIINNINQQPFNIALLDNYIGTIDFTLFDISNNYIDTNLLNLITTDNSLNLGAILKSDFKGKDKPKTSKGIGGKKPGDARFNIRNHLSYIEKLRNNKISNLDLSGYLLLLELSPNLDANDYINNLKNMYEYDIYSNNNDISYILNKYYY
tara:strand:+ start:713 stop:1174 length:462 start_codon:yes stop_codon:yes gene_type:complete